jgi:hypothetical protein
MLKAKTKYDMLVSSKDRPFCMPSDEEQLVIALKAELEQFKDSNLSFIQLTKAIRYKSVFQSFTLQVGWESNCVHYLFLSARWPTFQC